MPKTPLQDFFQNDRFANYVGVELLEASPGKAKARLQIGDHHRNAAGVVHGAAIFSLADLAFAVASNSHGPLALGVNVAISYLKAAVSGTLTAEAEEVALTAKLGTYAVRVVDEQGTPIALFQGTVYRKGQGGQQNGPILSDIVS